MVTVKVRIVLVEGEATPELLDALKLAMAGSSAPGTELQVMPEGKSFVVQGEDLSTQDIEDLQAWLKTSVAQAMAKAERS